jgi:flagellar protein FlaF
MDVHNLKQAMSGYAASTTAVRTERGSELRAFEMVTRRLNQAEQSGAFTRLSAALHENRKLWTILAIDVADETNQLSQSLRAQIFYLAEFVDAHTSRVLAGKSSAAALIDVNQAVMRGLRGQGEPK